MRRVLEEYSADELLDWLAEEDMDIYLLPTPMMIDDESTIVTKLDIGKIKDDFIRSVRRYSLVKRGKMFYVHDEQSCQDIMTYRFNDENEHEIQNIAKAFVDDLNDRRVTFIGKKHHCG